MKLPKGHTVRYHHSRLREQVPKHPLIKLSSRPSKIVIAPKGGRTTASVYDEDGKLVAVGFALCNPTDNFVKAEGRRLALERALVAFYGLGVVINEGCGCECEC